MSIDDAAKVLLQNLRCDHRFRVIPTGDVGNLIDLSSNDYMSLASNAEEYFPEFLKRLRPEHLTSSASRLLSSRQDISSAFENRLEELYGRPALLFNSGYHANTGTISALASLPDTVIFADKLAHASMLDGLAISRKEFRRFRHNDISHLRTLIDRYGSGASQILIITESIFSMDGDEAPLRELVALKSEYPGVFLYVDEAHAFGVRGESGLGLAQELGLMDEIDLLLVTLGKAAAASGAFVVCSQDVKSLLINCSRSFIFSTAQPPAAIVWASIMVEALINMSSRRKRLVDLSNSFITRLNGITTVPSPSQSQIVPWIIGGAEKTLRAAAMLREAGFLALPIRRPTVPPGSERIRFSLSASLTDSELSSLIDAINYITPRL